MHEAFWNGLFDTRWEDAPLGREAIRLVLWLRKRGYRERSCRVYAHAVVHLGRHLHEAQADVTPGALDEAVVADFIAHHLPVCRCYHQRPGRRQDHVRWGLAQLLAMLHEQGEIPPSTSPRPTYDEVLEGYCRFLRHDRGLAETTITNYRRYVRDFLISRGDTVGCRELAQLTPDDLLTFSRQRGAGLGATAWNHLALSVSHFYRWLDLGGHRSQHLVGTVPLRRRYRLADVPRALSWEQVQRLLAVVDRHAPSCRGCRRRGRVCAQVRVEVLGQNQPGAPSLDRAQLAAGAVAPNGAQRLSTRRGRRLGTIGEHGRRQTVGKDG